MKFGEFLITVLWSVVAGIFIGNLFFVPKPMGAKPGWGQIINNPTNSLVYYDAAGQPQTIPITIYTNRAGERVIKITN